MAFEGRSSQVLYYVPPNLPLSLREAGTDTWSGPEFLARTTMTGRPGARRSEDGFCPGCRGASLPSCSQPPPRRGPPPAPIGPISGAAWAPPLSRGYISQASRRPSPYYRAAVTGPRLAGPEGYPTPTRASCPSPPPRRRRPEPCPRPPRPSVRRCRCDAAGPEARGAGAAAAVRRGGRRRGRGGAALRAGRAPRRLPSRGAAGRPGEAARPGLGGRPCPAAPRALSLDKGGVPGEAGAA